MSLLKKGAVTGFFILTITLFQHCSKKTDTGDTNPPPTVDSLPDLPATAFNYQLNFPAHIQTDLAINDNTPANNAITNDGATLGRVLFYDKHLSKNNTISCGSCHSPELSFSDNAVTSKGFEGGLTPRHSMPLLNVRFYKSGKMFWDERSPTLEDQVLQPIQNHVEMGMAIADMQTKVAAIPYYADLFQKAFGSAQVDSIKIAKALSQFVRSIVTYQSKYDKVKQGLQTFTAGEARGELLFLTAGAPTCAGCHAPPMFLTSTPANGFALADATDHGINNQNRFKVGTLRNIVNTAPYFHNGSVATLRGMLTGNIPQHGVLPQDVQPLLDFLNTLTDQSVTTDAKFLNPF